MQVTYSIVGGADGAFVINDVTGELSVVPNMLDREMMDTYNVQVR